MKTQINMKIIITTFLFISNISFCFAQNPNFFVENDLVHWRYVFEDTASIEGLKRKPKLEFLSDTNGILKKSSVNDPRIKHEMTAEFTIEQREGRYRVTVNNIRFYNTTQIQIDMFSSTLSDYPIETSLLRKNKTIKEKIWGIDLTEILNEYFLELFTIKITVEEDW